MNEITKRKTTTYDAVETALELSKESGTWEELIRSRGAKPWASETKLSPIDCRPPAPPDVPILP
jgi:hypothetical protein